MKNFLELCKKRQSVRSYSTKKIPGPVLNKCLEAARLSPSAENTQPWRFAVIDKEPLLLKVKETAFSNIYFPNKWAKTAPVIVVILARVDIKTKMIGPVWLKLDYYLFDIGIAAQHMVLEAEDNGIGSCYLGWFNFAGVKKLLKIPKKYKLIGLLAMGYPDKKNKLRPKKRKNMSDIVWFNEIK
ncbi:MAG: nitroreductase family protein [Spirochaetes bacterium]|nr:nitroreductase family protein [Spirochaetota bacterium]